MRDQAWLENLTQTIWTQHFNDVKPVSFPQVKFGRKAKNRLGSLSYNSSNRQTIIRITKLFQDPDVPELVIKGTLVHELCHYAHGFHSGLKPRYQHPHRGGVVRQEFAERGLEELYVAQKKWLKHHWPAIVRKYYPATRVRFKKPNRKSRILFRLF